MRSRTRTPLFASLFLTSAVVLLAAGAASAISKGPFGGKSSQLRLFTFT